MSIYAIIQRQGIDPYVWGGVVTWQRVIATIGQPNFLAAYVCMSFFLMFYFVLTYNQPANGNFSSKVKNNSKKEIKKDDIYLIGDKLLPIVYYIAVPLLFIVMVYSQSGSNVFIWYLFFAAMTFAALRFAYTYNKLPDIVLKILVSISLVLNYVCLFYTQSRGGYLALIVGATILIIFVPRKRFFENWKILSVLFLVIFLITIITAVNPKYSPFGRFSEEIKLKDVISTQTQQEKTDSEKKVVISGAAGSRGETWKSAFGIIADRPFWGTGPEVLKMIFPRYETNLFRFKEAFHVKQDRCHNETFDVPSTKGLITFFVYLFILFLIYQFAFKKIKTVDADKKVFIVAVIAAITSYLIQNQFSFGVLAITSLFWVLWALLINVDSIPDKEDERDISWDSVPWLYVFILFVFICFLGYVFMLQFNADKYFKMGKNYMDYKRYQEALPWFEKSLKTFPIEGGTVTNKGIDALNASLTGKKEEVSMLHKEAQDTFEYGIKVDPYNADNFYIASRILFMDGNLKKSKEYAENALKVDPYYAEAYLVLAAISEKEKKIKEAQDYYKKAYFINPGLSEPKIKVALEKIEQGALDEAFNMFQELLISDPGNPQVHNGLGIIYKKKGNNIRAKEEFEQTLQLDPNNEYAKLMLGQ